MTTSASTASSLIPGALALAALLAACGPVQPSYTGGSGIPPGGGGTTGSPDAGTSDAGSSASLPTQSCGDDPDGVFPGGSGLVVSEIAFGTWGFFELHNRGPNPLDLTHVQAQGSVQVTLPAATLSPGQKVLVAEPALPVNGELALGIDGQPSSYVCWGTPGPTQLQSAAIVSGLWTTPGACPIKPADALSLHLRGQGVFAGDFQALPPTPLGCGE